MQKNVRRIKIFVSSPNDLQSERQIVEDVCKEIELDRGQIDSFTIEVLKWETHARPAAGTSAQETITQQIGLDYDIYLGLLGLHFGTATANWRSGTEEEFQLALERYRREKFPKIMFYFANRSVKIEDVDSESLSLRNKFKKDLEKQDILHWNYEDDTQLRVKLFRHLSPTIREVLCEISADSSTKESEFAPDIVDPLASWHQLLASNAEISVSRLMSASGEFLESFTNELGQLGMHVQKYSKNLTKQTNNLKSQSDSKNLGGIQTALGNIEIANNTYIQKLLDSIPRLHEQMDKALTGTQRWVNMRLADDNIVNAEIQQLIPSFKGLLDAMKGAEHAVLNVENGINSWPNELGAISLTKFQLLALHDDLIAFLRRTQNTLTEMIESIRAVSS